MILSDAKGRYYVDESDLNPSAREIIEIIKQAGGKVFIPHIFMYGNDSIPFLEGLTKEFEIDGIECWYPKHTKEQEDFLIEFCKENGYLMSAGSDFHYKPGYPMEVGTGVSAKEIGWLK